MEITYNGITIPFFDTEECKNLDNVKLGENGLPEQVLVSLSGGCDSASALYLCLTHFPDIEWLPYTCRDLNAPGDADSAIMFIDKMQKEFPHANLQDIQVFEQYRPSPSPSLGEAQESGLFVVWLVVES